MKNQFGSDYFRSTNSALLRRYVRSDNGVAISVLSGDVNKHFEMSKLVARRSVIQVYTIVILNYVEKIVLFYCFSK